MSHLQGVEHNKISTGSLLHALEQAFIVLPFFYKSFHHVIVEAEKQSDAPRKITAGVRLQAAICSVVFKDSSSRALLVVHVLLCLCDRRFVPIMERVFRALKDMLGIISAFRDL